MICRLFDGDKGVMGGDLRALLPASEWTAPIKERDKEDNEV